jgi:hypothetical protein
LTKKTDGEFLKRSKARGRSTDGWERKKTAIVSSMRLASLLARRRIPAV